MEIVTGTPAPTLAPDETRRLLLEMAAVVRTIFGAPATPDQPATTDQPAGRVDVPPAVEAPAAPAIAAIPVAGIPVPALPLVASEGTVPVIPLVAPESTVPVPLVAPEVPDSAERHSLVLLQEIAFLDD